MDPVMIVVVIAVAIVGIVLGFIVNRFMAASSNKQAAGEAANLVEDARKQAETMRREAEIEAKDQALRYRQELEEEKKERMREVRSAESRVAQREETLAQREESLDRRVESLDAREHQLSSLQGQVERRERDVNEAENAIERHREEAQIEINQALERAAGMSPEEAKAELLETIRDDVTRESAVIIRDAETRTKAEADKKAREILSLAIQRVAADHSAESTVSTIHIPSDDLKGRIIGREGRNIRSFEQLTGTNLIIDDTPECVTISCFDPVRREIGRVTMENLIADGRIHPARIEEMYGKAVKLVNQRVQEAGEQASFDAGIHDLHPELVNTLGRLRYRTSFGQNVLNHSLEVAYLASVMASELGLGIPAEPLFRSTNMGSIPSRSSAPAFCMIWARRSTTKSKAAMPSSAPILPVASASAPKSFTPSRPTTTISSRTLSSTCSSRPQMPFRRPAPARARRRSTPTSSVWKSSRRSPMPMRAWSALTPSRPAARCASW